MSDLADKYEYVTYGTGRAQIRDPDGTVRDATPDELVRLKHVFEPALKESFRVVVSEMTFPASSEKSMTDFLDTIAERRP